jgi:hypothetical protein
MGKNFIITEEDRKHIRGLYEQGVDPITTIYNKIKNKPIFQKIEKLYDPNINTFVRNVVNSFPTLKNKESIIVQQVQTGLKNPISYVNTNQSEIDKFSEDQLQEFPVGMFILFALIILIILIVRKNRPTPTPTPTPTPDNEATIKLKELDGKTVNLYNEPDEQMLYGKVMVFGFKFNDYSSDGGRSKVTFISSPGLSHWSIQCLSNPSRLGSSISGESGTVYNKEFTDKVQELVGSYCKKPSADYAYQNKDIDPSKMG